MGYSLRNPVLQKKVDHFCRYQCKYGSFLGFYDEALVSLESCYWHGADIERSYAAAVDLEEHTA